MGFLFSKATWDYALQLVSFQPTFTAKQLPNLSKRVALVTGGNAGIGYETVKALLEHDAKVYLAARSRDKALVAIELLRQATGKEAVFLELDLADLASVKRAADVFLGHEGELHMLFNNAGVMASPLNVLTRDGYDMQFGTNVIGHFLLTELLMPSLIAGVDSSPDRHTRVITTSSESAFMGTLQYNTLRDSPARSQKRPTHMYQQSKFANVVVARQIAKLYAHKGIISISVHPGTIDTDMLKDIPSFARFLLKPWTYPASYGALTQLYAGTMPQALNYNGEFLVPIGRLSKCRAEAYDDAVGKKLWQWLQNAIEPFRK